MERKTTKKLQAAIEKSNKKGFKGPRDAKKKMATKKKKVEFEDEEITSNDSSIEDTKNEGDDFFIAEEEGKFI